MKAIRYILSSLSLISISSIVIAGHYDNESVYAPVVEVHPIYENYQVPENRRVCDNGSRSRSNQAQYNNNGGGALLGGIIGGLIGNRFGKGNGRKAATAAGVLIGASVGSNARPKGYYSNNRRLDNRNRRQCYNQRIYRTEQKISGYDVAYDYNGQIYQTRLQNHPGDRVRLNVRVQVAEY